MRVKSLINKSWVKVSVPVFLLWVTGCSTLVRIPEGAPPLTAEQAHQGWQRVLKEFVNDKGQVNFTGLAAKRADLDNYVAYIAKVGPRSRPSEFSDQATALAHYINSYNALSMFNILDSEIPDSLGGLKKVKFFYFKKFIIDGEEMSLYDYENKIIRKIGEERVHFALNCMSKGCPRLPRIPFTGKRLNQELEEQAQFFFSEERNVRVDNGEKTVYLSEILDFFPEDFLKKASSLIAYANRYRTQDMKLPEGYKVDFISYDWKVNSSSAKP